MDMSLVSSISEMKAMEFQAQAGAAIAKKVMDTTSGLQADLLNQMMGIGQNLNIVA